MQALSGIDAAFLYLETPTAHMHVGGVTVCEGSLAFDDFRELVSSRIHLVPKLQKRLIEVPLSIDYPYWVDDPDFNVDLHLQHIALPRPGDWRQLRKLAARIYSEPLDRSRPLWQFVFVEGLDNIPQVPPGSVAIISKIHHSAIDGVSGADIMGLLFDTSPEGREIEPPKARKTKPVPNDIEMVFHSTRSFMMKPLKFPRLMVDTMAATVKTGMLTRVPSVDIPPVPFTAPKTRLNGVISAQRTWNTALLELDRIKEIKNIMGCTVNDVMVAICSGALRNYLNDKGELPAKPLVAMIPISIRSKNEKDSMGNKISSMLVQLATDIADPVERLQQIQRNTQSGKAYQGAIGARTLSDVAEFVPFGLANQATRMYSRMQLADHHNPIFNVVITNVPGPQFDLYLSGHKLLANLGMGPIIDGMGLIIPVLSYNGIVSISPTSDVNTMPDMDVFARLLRESANELEAAVLKLRPEEDAADEVGESGEAAEPESAVFFNTTRDYLAKHPELVKPNQGIFQFNITGPSARTWTIDLQNEPGSVTEEASDAADAIFTIRDDHFVKVLRGELDMQIAFMQGKLKVKGDIGKALKLGPILAKLPAMPV